MYFDVVYAVIIFFASWIAIFSIAVAAVSYLMRGSK